MRSPWSVEPRAWDADDAGSPAGVIAAAMLLTAAIFVMPVVADKFLAPGLSVPDILLFSAMPGIIAYRFFCAAKLPLKQLESGELLTIAGIALLLALFCGLVTAGWKLLLDIAGVHCAPRQYALELVKRCHGVESVKLFFAICVFTPIIEELLFRRIVYGTLLRFGTGFAFAGSALLFSFCHFFVAGLPGLFILALTFQFVYLKYRNLSAAIVLHGLFNSISFGGVLLFNSN